MSVFLCLSAPKFPVFNRWLRLVLTSALDEMTDSLNPPDLPVCFMLDELATLGHLQAAQTQVGQLELLAEELRMAQKSLGEITGEFSADDLLGEIFGRFCIGK